ncbi:MAG: DUF1841 family protein [Legionellales bacterium]|nr:DUF1841 family protein [Legionellales bacterium]
MVLKSRHFPQPQRLFSYVLQQQPLDQLESPLLAMILQHPEYHATLEQQDIDYQYQPEQGMSNPFLHMGLHLALRDQILLDRPQGIKTVFQNLLERHGDAHHVEHLCIEQLALSLWNAQRDQRLPDEQAYLLACQNLA